MNTNEFEDLMDKCCIALNDDGNVSFTPFSDKDEERISKIIADNGLEKISLNDFNEIVAKHRSLYMVRQKLKQQKAEQFSAMTTKQVAELPLEQKIGGKPLMKQWKSAKKMKKISKPACLI